MNETFNVFDTSNTLIESEGPPEIEEAIPFEERQTGDGEIEPDYFVVEAPRKKRPSFSGAALGALAVSIPRRRVLAALALLGGLILVVSLLGATSEPEAKSPAPVQAQSEARVESASPPAKTERLAWVAISKRAMRAKLTAEAVAPAQVVKVRARSVRATAKDLPAPSPDPQPETSTSVSAPPVEPETSSYVPTEVAPPPPAPTPSSSPAGESGQEFGIEP